MSYRAKSRLSGNFASNNNRTLMLGREHASLPAQIAAQHICAIRRAERGLESHEEGKNEWGFPTASHQSHSKSELRVDQRLIGGG
jgi:hypothetical protein